MSKGGELFRLERVCKVYQIGDVKVQALRGISFRIEAGEYVAVMGPSGSGKSTLMHVIGCLDRPTSGALYLKGKDVSSLSDDELSEVRNSEIGFVFQDSNLLSEITLLENVEMPLIYANVSPVERRRRAMAALEMVGLKERIKHRPNEVSGGQRQRAAIARALVNHPSIILADEPTGNLDTNTGKEIMGLFDALNRQGNTIVLVTHERKVAEHASRIIHIRDGMLESTESKFLTADGALVWKEVVNT